MRSTLDNDSIESGLHRRAIAAALSRPRRILLIIKAGAPVDEIVQELTPLLSPDDVVIDGGNSFFADTQRREAALREPGVRFVGMGVSGGEEGALYGPSLMPGGARSALDQAQSTPDSGNVREARCGERE